MNRPKDTGLHPTEAPLLSTESDEDACAKLWEVYSREAQRYDEGLVRSWKDDMDVTLVFSGLYSAILTAFLIESYKNLQEDYTETSAILLRQLTIQLANSSSGLEIVSPPVNPFSPPANALACNILWFLSLTFALFCAFLATFVQQWARQFLHRINTVQSSIRHARLLQFFYYGFKELKMHAFVAVIPTLLHMSLFFFFGGLVAFLSDVNPVLTAIMALALLIITSSYLFFTLLPLFKKNSSYQTPFSPFAWSVLRRLQLLLRFIYPRKKLKHVQSPKPTHDTESAISTTENEQTIPLLSSLSASHVNLADAVLADSLLPNHIRDCQSVQWTLKSLSDDNELLPFVEGLADALLGPSGLRAENFYLLKPLLETTDAHLDILSRVTSMMVNAQSVRFDGKHRERCALACPKLLCILAWTLWEYPDTFSLTAGLNGGRRRLTWFSGEIFSILEYGTQKMALNQHYAISAAALIYLTMSKDLERALPTLPSEEQLRNAFGTHLTEFIESEVGNSPNPITLNQATTLQHQILLRRSKAGLQYIARSTTCFPYAFLHIQPRFGDLTTIAHHELQIPLSLLVQKLSDLYEQEKAAETVKEAIDSTCKDLDSVFRTLFDGCQPSNSHLVVQYLTNRIAFAGPMSTPTILESALHRRSRFLDITSDLPRHIGPEWTTSIKDFILSYGSEQEWTEGFDKFCADTLLSLKAGNRSSADQLCLVFFLKFLALSRLPTSNDRNTSLTIACIRQDVVYDTLLGRLPPESRFHLWPTHRGATPINHQFYTEKILTATVESSAVVSGFWEAEFGGSLTAADTITVSPSDYGVVSNGTFRVTGDVLTGEDWIVKADLDISASGNVTLGGDLIIVGYCSVAGKLTIGGNLFCKGIRSMTGVITLGYDLRTSADIHVSGKLHLGGNLQTDGVLYVDSNAEVALGKSLSVYRDVHISGNLWSGGNCHVGRSLFGRAGSKLSLGRDLRVDGNLDLQGSLEVGRDIHVIGRAYLYDCSINVGGDMEFYAFHGRKHDPLEGNDAEDGNSVPSIPEDVDIMETEAGCSATLLQLLRDLNPTANPTEAREALEFFCHLGLHNPTGSAGQHRLRLATSQIFAFEIAKTTRRLSAFLKVDAINYDILDIIKIMWKLFAVTLTFVNPKDYKYDRKGIWWAHPLIDAARILLSSDAAAVAAIKEAEKIRWKQRQKERYTPVDYGFALLSLAEEIMKLLEDALLHADPCMIPLPDPDDSDDEEDGHQNTQPIDLEADEQEEETGEAERDTEMGNGAEGEETEGVGDDGDDEDEGNGVEEDGGGDGGVHAEESHTDG